MSDQNKTLPHRTWHTIRKNWQQKFLARLKIDAARDQPQTDSVHPTASYYPYFLVLFIVVLTVCTVVEATGLSRLYYTWQDDVYMGVLADKVRAEGLRPYWQYTSAYALWQGRAYFYFSFFFFIAPFLTNSALIRTVIIILVELCSIGMIGVFLSLYLTRVAGMLFVALTLCLLPHWMGQYPTANHIVVYHLPLALFFGSMCLYVRSMRASSISERRRGLSFVLSTALLFFSLFIYEVLIPPFFLICAIVVWAEQRKATSDANWRKRRRSGGLFAGAFFLWALTYVGYRIFHPPQYPGAQLAPLNLRLSIVDVWHHVVKSLPAANSFVMLPRIGASPSLFGQYLISHTGTGGLIEAILIAALLLLAAKTGIASRGSAAIRSINRPIAVFGVALLCGVLVPIPLSLTVKYRGWPWENLPYIPDYYIYLSWMVAVSAVLVVVIRTRNRLARVFGILVITAGASFFTLTGAVVNASINERYAEDSKKWKLVDLFCRTAAFHNMPADSIVIAPTLWEGLDPTLWFVQDFYWTNYVRVRTGRNIRITRTIDAASKALDNRGHVYYVEHQWAPGRSSSVLLIFAVSESGSRIGTLLSDSVTIVSDSDLHDFELEYNSATGAEMRAGVPSLNFESGAFVGSIPAPGLRAGTARIVGNAGGGAELSSFPIQFEEGFSTEEHNGTLYWRWSDRPSGEGTLVIDNPWGTRISAVFQTKLLTGGGLKRFVFEFAGNKDEVTAANQQLYAHQLTLSPGKNRIVVKCNCPRIQAPGDNRYLVFGLEGWSITPK